MSAVLAESITRMPQRLLVALVRGYRFALSPWLGSACRFEPTCSAYALQALDAHGAVAGSRLAAARLLRCHPWCRGGVDPVPAHTPALFAFLHGGSPRPRRSDPSPLDKTLP